ncbi:MAG TPA: hypothetical protein VL356_01740 [Acidocella sp.]|jgi:hypothetical protein|nr:hypothetical protein [Acidocella sp.]
MMSPGQKRAARAVAKPASAAVAAGLHGFVARRFFSVALNGQIVSFHPDQRYVVDEAAKAIIGATSADVTWETQGEN